MQFLLGIHCLHEINETVESSKNASMCIDWLENAVLEKKYSIQIRYSIPEYVASCVNTSLQNISTGDIFKCCLQVMHDY